LIASACKCMQASCTASATRIQVKPSWPMLSHVYMQCRGVEVESGCASDMLWQCKCQPTCEVRYQGKGSPDLPCLFIRLQALLLITSKVGCVQTFPSQLVHRLQTKQNQKTHYQLSRVQLVLRCCSSTCRPHALLTNSRRSEC